MTVTTSFASICIPISHSPTEYIKAYFPIDVIDHFKTKNQQWYYWPSEQDMYPYGVSPYHPDSQKESIRYKANLYGLADEKENTVDFRNCARTII